MEKMEAGKEVVRNYIGQAEEGKGLFYFQTFGKTSSHIIDGRRVIKVGNRLTDDDSTWHDSVESANKEIAEAITRLINKLTEQRQQLLTNGGQ